MTDSEYQPGRIFKSPATLDQLQSLIFNETFFADNIRYDSDERIVTIPFMRCLYDEDYKVLKKSLFRAVYERPVLKCELIIRSVEELKLVNRADNERHIFYGFEYNPKVGRIDIRSYMPIEFYLYVSGFHVEYTELKQQGRAVFSGGRFPFKWEMGPKFLDI